jgi:Uma2 family endonuclease
MNPDSQLNLITSLLQSDPKIFRPFEMDIVKDFNKNPDLVVDINSLQSDEYQKRGLIIQTQKVRKRK